MSIPTLHTLARLLTPWRTIRRLEAENKRLKEQAVLRAQVNWEARKLIDLKYDQLATAREALCRLLRWGGWPLSSPNGAWDADVALGVGDWLKAGMTGPLPPLPPHLTKREEHADAGEAP